MGIIGGYITVASDMHFHCAKAKRCIEALLPVYRFSYEKIAEALEFIGRSDFKKIAKEAVDKVFREFEIRKNKFLSKKTAGILEDSGSFSVSTINQPERAFMKFNKSLITHFTKLV